MTAVLVTRGNVDMQPVLDSLPREWRHAVWDNSKGDDLSVYGRYAAIEHAARDSDLIYVQDDDVIVSDPQAIVDAWKPGHVVCNMPPEFRPHYPDSGLVGFGACFERELPAQAFARFEQTVPTLGLSNYGWSMPGSERFNRECDAIVTGLSPRILVDVPKEDRRFASDPDRLWQQPEHHAERAKMLDLVRLVRDAT